MEILIIKIIPYKEKDAIITAINDTGVFSILVKGMLSPKGKNTALNNLMTIAEIDLNDSKKYKYDVLKSSRVIFSPLELISNPSALVKTQFVCNLIDKCLTDKEKPLIYQEILEFIDSCKGNKDLRFNLLRVLSKILSLSGYPINVDSCQCCGSTKQIVGFSLNSGGFICKDCLRKASDSQFSADDLLMIRKIFKDNTPQGSDTKVDRELFNKLVNRICNFLEDNCGINLKNRSMILD